MKNRITYFFSLILVLTVTSCSTYKVIEIQTLRPSEISIPKNFSQPLVVANLYEGIEGVEESLAQAALDSIAGTEAALVLTESLYDSPWFQGVSIPNSINYRNDNSKYILPFTWEQAREVADLYNADLLISLEYVKIEPVVEQYDYWEGYLRLYYGSLTTNVYAYWRVYDVPNKKVLGDYLFRDTLIWENSDYRKVRVGDQLPGFFSAGSYCGYLIGSEYAKKIAPGWMNEKRIYYSTGSKEMKMAADFVEKNMWLDAAAQWQKVLSKPNQKKNLAAMAAFNMALANELLGNFDVAIEWLNKSKEYETLPDENWYRKIIEYRIKIMEKL